MHKDTKAHEIVKTMMELDQFSNWMGVKIIDIKEGYSKIEMLVRNNMLNAFGIAHGGITFALADSAFAFACNSNGKITVALDVSISFPKAAKEADILTAEAKRVSNTNKTGLYLIEVTNQHQQLVALFKGTCYKTEKDLVPALQQPS